VTAVCLRTSEADVLQRIASAHRVGCFLDYDGTLTPLAPTPDAARPLPGTAALLEQLAAAPGMLVAIVTGRTVADMRRFLDVRGVYYVGIHGLETRLPDGTVEMSEGVEVARAVLPSIKQQLQDAIGTRPGILLEDKALALACHYRSASRHNAAAAHQVVARVAETYQRRGVEIAVTHGHEVTEIRPAAANKGKAVCRLLALHGSATLAVYVGDDQTDEDAFRLLPAESITIQVGPATMPTAARYRVAQPANVQRFLYAVRDCRSNSAQEDERPRVRA
jgi:trehalose 6-phosphate phosphatase